MFVVLLLVLPATPTGPTDRTAPITAGRAAGTPWALSNPARPTGATGLAHPAALTSLDWDGMGTFRLLGVNTNLVLGEGAAMVADSTYRNVVVFGGRGSAGLTNLTLEVSQVTGKWKNVTGPVGPSPRANMSFADDPSGRLAVLFGGTTNPRTGVSDNQTWAFWYGNHTWENVTHAVAPPARESAAFAVDPAARLALLEGGRDPAFVQGGSTGSVTWNDTWTLNLTTFNWTPVTLRDTPPPRFASAMAFDPLNGEFLIFGGCDAACTNAVEAVNLSQGSWATLLPPPGTQVPAPGGGAVFVWSPWVNATVMFGGFGPTTSAFASYNSTFVFDPATRTWNYVQGPPDPFARYAAPGAWLSANGCPGLFLAGGSSAFYGPPPDLWFLDPNPDTGVGCNVWGNDQVGTGGGNTTGCNGNGTLVVIVSDNATHARVANATITLTGACGAVHGPTDLAGVATLTRVPLTVETVTVSASGYHAGGTVVNVTANYTANRTGPVPPPIWVNLTHLPSLRLRTYGQSVSVPRFPLGAVDITMDDFLDFGNTSAAGYLNESALSAPGGRLTFRAYKLGFSTPEFVTTLPYTGVVWVNFTLQQEGAFEVEARLAGSTRPIVSATGVITPLDAGAPLAPVGFAVDVAGNFSVPLPLGNYSVAVSAPGYGPNATKLPVFHGWANTTVVVVYLTSDEGYNVTVLVRDASTRSPIFNATVEVGSTYLAHTSAAGWANFSNIRPPGPYGILAAAPGYATNQSFVFLGPGNPRASVTIYLTPVPCTPPACTAPRAIGAGGFILLPSSSDALVFLLAAPLLFLGAAVVYALYLRRRTSARGAR